MPADPADAAATPRGPLRPERILAGGGAAGAAVRAHDWAGTPLGGIGSWPASLLCAASLVLNSREAMVLGWGFGLTSLVNDAALTLLGRQGRGALGRPLSQLWPDAWERLEPLARSALGGTATLSEPVPVCVRCGGEERLAYVRASFSPVRDEGGAVAGLLQVLTETADEVLDSEEQQAGTARWRTLFEQAPGFMALVRGPDHRFEFANSAYRRLVARDDLLGQPMRAVLPHMTALGSFERLDEAFHTGRMYSGRSAPMRVTSAAKGPAAECYVDFVCQPFRDASGAVSGIFINGYEVTEHIRGQQALLRTHEQLRMAQAAGGVGVFTIEIASNTLIVSPEFCRIYGLPFQESFPATIVEHMVHPADAAQISMQRDRAAGTSGLDVEYRIRRPDNGEERWVSRRAEFVRGGAGAPVQMRGVVQDVTARKAAEATLRASEQRFRILAQAMPNPVWTAQPDGQLDWLNEQALALNDRTMEEVCGTGWATLVHPDDRPRVHGIWSHSVATGEPYETEFRILRGDGEYRWNLVRAMPVMQDGRVVQWVGTNTDIEDQKRAQAHLRELNTLLATSVEERTVERDNLWSLSQDAFLISDSHDGTWRSVSPAWQHILGWREDELLGRTSDWLLHPDDGPATRALMRRLAAGQAASRFENRLRTRDGSYRWMSWTAHPHGGRNYCIARDVTEDRERAAALERTQEELRQSQKMEAVGQLTGGIAHDFNNLLTGIIGSLDMVRRRLADGRTDGLLRAMDRATASAQRAAALTHRLLAFSRRQSLDNQAIDVNALVDSMQDLLGRTLGRHMRLHVGLQPDLWPAFTDANQLENALLNLAINARDAMPDGGTLHIETLNVAGLPTDAPLGGDHVCIKVTDTGIGMDEPTLARAFEPFFTTKPAGQGTGLGLSMIYGFVKQSHGHLDLASTPGVGTTVTICLPRHEGPLHQAADPEPGHATISGGGEAILLVEDDEVVRALTAEGLHDIGFRVTAAADAPAALAALAGAGPLDLMICDVGLPGMGGRELAEAVRQQRPSLPVLFVTGYAPGAAARSGFLGPGMDLLGKPFTIEVLGAKVRAMLADRAFLLL